MLSSPRKQSIDPLTLAKRVLLLPPSVNNSKVPAHFLAEVQRTLTIFPFDTEFIVIAQPGKGFGTVICQEEGCVEMEIPLTQYQKIPDGGKKDGVGSLMPYRDHINKYPPHKASRLNRVQASKSSRSNSLNSSSSSPAHADKSKGRLVAVNESAVASRNTSSLVPKKRLSEGLPDRTANLASATNGSVGSRSTLGSPEVSVSIPATPGPGSAKKARLTKVPFAPHDENRSSNSSPPTRYAPMDPVVPDAQAIKAVSKDAIKRSMNMLRSGVVKSEGLATPSPLPDSGAVRPIAPAIMKHAPPTTASSLGSTSVPGPALSNDYSKLQSDERIRNMLGMKPSAQDILHGIANVSNGNSMNDSSDSDEDPYDDQGNWRGLGRDRIRGPMAQSGELEKFFQDATSGEYFEESASVTKGLERLGLPDMNKKLPGMSTKLLAHQVIGVAWMVDKENSYLKGGLLCDEMGLGKTVQMIATMSKNPSDDPAVKTTLIIAPLALLNQWEEEIEEKTGKRMSVYIYHGQNKTKDKKELQKHDVVLTTYSTMALEWPDLESDMRKEEKQKRKKKKNGFITSDSDEDFKPKKKKQKLGLLFNVTWYRIVLDEAQYIKGRRTRSSRAAADLVATYRWCLTGTPITNSLADAYPLLRFIRLRPWWDWEEEFYPHIARNEKRYPNDTAAKLQTILMTCFLRRKKDTKLDGKPLVELPPKEVTLTKLEFTPDERDIYKAVETMSQIKFNKYLRAGTVLKNYMNVLALLLRLRQICSHTALICEESGVIIDDNIENTTESKRDEIIRAQRLLGRKFVEDLKEKMKKEMLARVEAEHKSADASIENEECPVCFDALTDAVVTPCGHFYCRQCIDGHITNARAHENDPTCPTCRGPISAEKLFSREAFEPTDEELASTNEGTVPKQSEKVKADDEDMPDIKKFLDSPKREQKSKKLSKGKAKAQAERKLRPGKSQKKRRVVDSEDEADADDVDIDEEGSGDDYEDSSLSDFIVQTDEDEDEKDNRLASKRLTKRGAARAEESESDDEKIIFGRRRPVKELSKAAPNEPIQLLSRMLPSTKMLHMMKKLEEWEKSHPDEKTMVVSQWTQNLQLVSEYLKTKGIGHVKFQGDMSRDERDRAVRKFKNRDDVRVMLMSLKCGGVGLNLTRSNRVISLDLGWSEAVENQAFDRVHRLGQNRDVFVERLVINDTVEDRVLAMQERKRNLAEGTLGEGSGKKLKRLTVRELANLFNLDVGGNVLS